MTALCRLPATTAVTTATTEIPAMAGATPRYALYFTPRPGGAHWLAGSRWLGRCAATRQALEQPQIAGLAAPEQQRLTAAPRRYGWHATLKAPFALAAGVDLAALRAALQALASSLTAFDLPPLEVLRLRDFLALVPAQDAAPGGAQAALAQAAAACVTQLQPLAAPLSAADLERRRSAAGLTPRQEQLLRLWGYPFVLDEFRFHLSLTGSLQAVPQQAQQLLLAAARRHFAELTGSPGLRFDGLALFVEPAAGADLVLLERLELAA